MACPSDFRRNADGSIDFDFYRRDAARLRALALRRAGRRLSRTLIDVARAALSPILRERPPRSVRRKRFTQAGRDTELFDRSGDQGSCPTVAPAHLRA
jgi:hypothetical protein